MIFIIESLWIWPREYRKTVLMNEAAVVIEIDVILLSLIDKM